MKNISSILISLFLFASCAKTTYTPVKLTSDREIYPAVFKVFEDLGYGIDFANPLKDSFKSGFAGATDIVNKIQFRIAVTKNVNGELVVSLEDFIELKDNRWREMKNQTFFQFDPNKFRNDITSKITAILADESKYNIAKDLALADMDFNIMSVATMTQVAANKWIEGLVGRQFNWKLPLLEFVPNEGIFKLTDKKYLARFNYRQTKGATALAEVEEYFFVSKIVKRYYRGSISINLYTDNDTFAKFNKNDIVDTRGKLISARKMHDLLLVFDFVP